MHYVYILYSKSANRFYKGVTTDLELRLDAHNGQKFKRAYTKISNDWEVFLIIPCNSKSQALLIEKHIKKMKSRVYLNNLKLYPEIVQKILLKY